MPPHIGWKIWNGNGAAFISTMNSSGVTILCVPRGAEFVDVRRPRGTGRRALDSSLPRAVRVRLVEEVRAELLPAALDVVEQGEDVVLADDRLAGIGAAELLHLVAVELPHLGRHGDEPGAEAGGPAGRHLAAAAEHQAGPARPIGRAA